MQKSKIQLYSNQVYVTDNVKEIVPEFLTLLHGVIDSPDIPLNVSRSYLQADQHVKKITGYITRKVAEKLGELFKEDRADYEKKWSDLGPFVKYGMITEDKFYDKAKKFVLFPTVEKQYYTLPELREAVKDKQTDKYERTILIYTHAPDVHHTAIQAAKSRGYEVLTFDNVLDNHFMQQLESKEDKLTFTRIDSATIDNLVQTDETKESVLNEEQQNQVKELFGGLVAESAQVELKPLAPDDQPVQIVRPEFMRRMKEMQAMQGMSADMFPDMFTVVVNSNHPLVAEKLLANDAKDTAGYLYDLALLSQNMLTGEKLTQFMNRSLDMLK
jgi:molecular chaperone HtpG